MPADEANHAAFVEAWLDEAAKSPTSLPPAQLVSLFERAMGALWQRAHVTLGEVSLSAIVGRVLYTASEQYPILSTLKIEGTGIRFDEFRQGAVEQDGDLPEVARFVLVEFLTVLGNLTDEILTPALHAELARVALEEPGTLGGDDEGATGARI
jgi:hypothetical protein